MPVEYFPHGITKSAFIRLSCRHYHNVRVKYQKMNTIIQNEIANQILFEHHIKSANATSTTSSGVIMLPPSFDRTILTYPCLKQFQNGTEVNLHLTCNHRCE